MRRLLGRLALRRKGEAQEPKDSGSPGVEIRPGRPADLPAVLAIERLSFQNPWSRAALRQELENPADRFLVASSAGSPPLAYAILGLGAGQAELLSLAVHPEARRRGLGRTLLETALRRAREAGAEVCHLEVRVTNEAALALYRRFGFVEVGRRRAYYADGTDAALMSRAL